MNIFNSKYSKPVTKEQTLLELADMFKMGYVILYKSVNTTTHQLIMKEQLKTFDITHAQWVHAEISGGGQWSVAVHPPSTETVNIFEKCKGRYIKVLKFKNKEYDKKKRYKIAFWSASTCNLRYDFWGIAAFKFPILHKIPFIKNKIDTLLFCSDNCLWSFRKEFPTIMEGLNTNDCMPAHFSVSDEFETVFEGNLPK